MSQIIFVDAGHGGSDPGAINGTRYEKHDTLRLAQAVQAQLQTQSGVAVVMSRTDDSYPTLPQRTSAANTAGADLFISLHRNSFTNATANGVEVWVYTTAGAVDVGAATEVLERLEEVGVQSNRGVRKGNYHVLRESNMTSMLVELGFITNTEDNRLYDSNLDAYAKAIAQGACAALGVQWREEDGSTGTGGLYRVQVGAFADEANARAFLETVREMGLDAFLVSPSQTGTRD